MWPTTDQDSETLSQVSISSVPSLVASVRLEGSSRPPATCRRFPALAARSGCWSLTAGAPHKEEALLGDCGTVERSAAEGSPPIPPAVWNVELGTVHMVTSNEAVPPEVKAGKLIVMAL